MSGFQEWVDVVRIGEGSEGEREWFELKREKRGDGDERSRDG